MSLTSLNWLSQNLLLHYSHDERTVHKNCEIVNEAVTKIKTLKCKEHIQTHLCRSREVAVIDSSETNQNYC